MSLPAKLHKQTKSFHKCGASRHPCLLSSSRLQQLLSQNSTFLLSIQLRIVRLLGFVSLHTANASFDVEMRWGWNWLTDFLRATFNREDAASVLFFYRVLTQRKFLLEEEMEQKKNAWVIAVRLSDSSI